MYASVKRSGSHSMFSPDDARAVVVFPRQMCCTNNWSRINVMNVDDEAVAVRVDFRDSNGALVYRHPDMVLSSGEAVVLNTSSYLSDGFEGTAVAYSVPYSDPSGDLPIRPSLVGVGDLMYADGHADGNRAAIYEATGQ